MTNMTNTPQISLFSWPFRVGNFPQISANTIANATNNLNQNENDIRKKIVDKL